MKKPRKTKSRRDKEKYPNLKAQYSPKVRKEYIDYDYLDKLNEEEKAWLNKFTGEFHGASFEHDETDIQSYEKYGKDCNDRNNSTNRDTYGILKNSSKRYLINYDNIIGDIENPLRFGGNPKHMENAYIDFIEVKEIEAMMQEYDQAMFHFNETDEILPQSSLD